MTQSDTFKGLTASTVREPGSNLSYASSCRTPGQVAFGITTKIFATQGSALVGPLTPLGITVYLM